MEEFEAECVSYLVCRRAGLKTRAEEYLCGYLDAHAKIPKVSFDAVFKAAQRIEAMRLRALPIRAPVVESRGRQTARALNLQKHRGSVPYYEFGKQSHVLQMDVI